MSVSMPKLKAVPVFWCGPPPAVCDICDRPIRDAFVDGRTRMGPWANMDTGCHAQFGTGLGTGIGQRFEQTPDGWLKTAG